MRTVEIIYNRTGQTVDLYPAECVRDLLGVPSAATASVYEGMDSNDDSAEFSPSVTADSVSTTVDQTSGVSQSSRNTLYLASTSNIAIGTLYMLENALGQREVVEPKGITTNDSVVLVNDLQFDYPITTSTFKGIKLTFTVDSTWVQTEANMLPPRTPSYRILWQYTVGGVVYNSQTYLRLVRKQFKTNVSVYDLTKRWPDALTLDDRARRGQGFKALLTAAIDDFRADVLAEGYHPSQLNDNELADQLVVLKGQQLLANAYGAPGQRDLESFLADAKQQYEGLFNRCMATLKLPVDVGTEGQTASEPIRQFFFVR